jgi:hypothetical protein
MRPIYLPVLFLALSAAVQAAPSPAPETVSRVEKDA